MRRLRSANTGSIIVSELSTAGPHREHAGAAPYGNGDGSVTSVGRKLSLEGALVRGAEGSIFCRDNPAVVLVFEEQALPVRAEKFHFEVVHGLFRYAEHSEAVAALGFPLVHE